MKQNIQLSMRSGHPTWYHCSWIANVIHVQRMSNTYARSVKSMWT